MASNMTTKMGWPVVVMLMGIWVSTLFICQACGGGGGGDTETPSSTKAWTYMVYLAGDNNLSSAAFGDLNEMEQVGSSDSVNIVVQVEFSQQYSNNLPEKTLRGKVTRDSKLYEISSSLTEIGNKNMGDKQTLAEFISWAKTNYPADHYALVLWDHGAGWKRDGSYRASIRGALEDATSGAFMSLPDIADGVRSGGVHFDLIDFDACLMAMYEVVYEFDGLTDYMVFSEEVEPGEGNPYDKILKKLTDDPQMTAKALCQTITKEYKTFYEVQDRTSVTKSAVDMSYASKLHEYLSGLAALMNGAIGTERPNIQSARDNSTQYAFPENHDIGNFLELLLEKTSNSGMEEKVNQTKSLFSNMIISNEVYCPEGDDPILESTGLSIYLPKRDQVTNNDLSQYALLAINQTRSLSDSSWGGFVNQLITGDEGEGLLSLETGPGNFVIWLQWDTDADLDLNVWEPDGTFAAPYIGASSPNGFLSEDSAYSGSSIEYYAAAETVAAGDYDILIEYYDDGSLPGGWTTVSLFLYDPEMGYSDFVPLETSMMSLNYPAPFEWYDDDNEILNVFSNQYSNWWYPTTLTRALTREGLPSETGAVRAAIGEKTFSIRMKPSKLKKKSLKRKFAEGKDPIAVKEWLKAMRETAP